MIVKLTFLSKKVEEIPFTSKTGQPSVYVKRTITCLDDGAAVFMFRPKSLDPYEGIKANTQITVDLVFDVERQEFSDGILLDPKPAPAKDK